MRVKRTGHVALPKINIYICIFLKEILARRENAVEFDLMDEGTIDDGEIVSFVFRGRRSKALSSDSLSIFE